MGALLMALLPLLGGLTQPIKDWFSYKQKTVELENNFKLAQLTAQAQQATQQMVSDTTDLSNRLGATSQQFKQGTFYPLWALVIFSVVFPERAEVMWHNFGIMPEWFQWLFLSVYSAIWGLPIVKGGYGAITELLSQRRDYKIEKIHAQAIRYNDAAMFKVLRDKVFTNGMTQQQVDAIVEAVKARDVT